MLATQNLHGDLRVWSVAKPAASNTPKVVRIIKCSVNAKSDVSCMAWSKNGHILHCLNGYVMVYHLIHDNLLKFGQRNPGL